MTPQELEKRLTELSPEQLRKFNADLGGGEKTVQERVTEFVHNPDHERGFASFWASKPSKTSSLKQRFGWLMLRPRQRPPPDLP